MRAHHTYFFLALGALRLVSQSATAQEDADPAEVAVGERLFLETRFAQSSSRTRTVTPTPISLPATPSWTIRRQRALPCPDHSRVGP
jgi:hypothetical protein